jgi:hypothetical protein
MLPPAPELISTRLIVHFKHESPRRHEDAQRSTDREAGLMEPAPLKSEKRSALWLRLAPRGGGVGVVGLNVGVEIPDCAVAESWKGDR